MIIAVMGCKSSGKYVDIGRQIYEVNKERKEAEKAAEAARIDAERKAEESRVAAEAAQQAEAEAELARRKNPGPHPEQMRDAANAAGHEYYTAGEQPPIVARDNRAWGRTLWKAQNDGGNGAVLLLDPSWMDAYKAGRITRVAICADPWGREVVDGVSVGRKVSGVGNIVAPYHERPAVRWDGLMGQAWRPGPVFIVMDVDGVRAAVWLLADPGMRVER